MKRIAFLFLAAFLSFAAYGQHQWEFMGLGYEKINTIAVDPRNPNVLFVGSQSVYLDTFGLGGIFKSTNGGLTWDTVGAPASVSKIVIHPTNSNIVYAALNSGNLMRPGIAKSTDAGESWFYADSGIYLQYPAYFQGIAVDPQYPETLYCGEAGNFARTLWKSTTGGRYWFPSDSGGISDNSTGGNIVIDPESTNIVYASSSGLGGAVWKTTNGGRYWYNLGIAWNAYGVEVLEMDPYDPATLYAVVGLGYSPPHVAKTTNKGLSWHLMSYDTMGIHSIACLTFEPNTMNRWYAGAGNVRVSSDGGIHWRLMDPPIQGLNGAVLAIAFAPDGSALYAGAQGMNYAEGSGVYKYTFVTSVEPSPNIPSSARLYQNFPNPFNPWTTMEFDLPRTGFVVLRVYNVLGQETATLVQETLSPGRHTVRWDATGEPSGIYVVRLQAGNTVETKKLLLLR